MVEIPFPLTTERLVLRRFSTDDLDDYYAYQKLPETARYQLGPERSYAQCMGKIAQFMGGTFDGPGDWASFALSLKGQTALIGEIALKWSDGGKPEDSGVPEDGGVPERVGEIGWTLSPAAQGRGYATEAARAVLELAFGQLNFYRMEARLDARNDASSALCERLGMHREGVLVNNMYLKGEWTSEAIYATFREPLE
ncbi:GCN5 family acetyltransferase [Arthrobacter sp. ERGS1:01]|uniref:GNAT family N-acetyltransferase n=1 Tax=Arthrobacter sp. ERGS1:01 TaxID=1704044 RepID=UPI0006B4ACEB|nr:GNAT family protein [Arthrobacter sp. ERGS1:01]ALE07188.1 GCN5 family acetyltransferase [Arthrobacter sp. ERGS1:01]